MDSSNYINRYSVWHMYFQKNGQLDHEDVVQDYDDLEKARHYARETENIADKVEIRKYLNELGDYNTYSF